MAKGGRMGRPPKARHLKIIEGNPGGRPLGPAVKTPPQKPRMPAYMRPYAKAVWQRLVPLLDSMGVLTSLDRDNLAGYCEAVASFKDATEKMHAGVLVQGRRKGEAVKNPAHQIQRDSARAMQTYSAMFGLSPADRERLGDAATAPGSLDIDEILAQ